MRTEENNKCSALVPEPRGTTWPPTWLKSPPVESLVGPMADSPSPSATVRSEEGPSRKAEPIGVATNAAARETVTTPFDPDGPIVPHGSILYWQDSAGRPCKLSDAYMWTWTGATRWYYVAMWPLPTPSSSNERENN
jgi:hypothetical protein